MDSEADNQAEDRTDDERTVPLSVFERVRSEEQSKRHALETQLAELKGKVDVLATTKPTETKEFTRAELRAAVQERKLTQDEADGIWDRQQEKRFDRKLETKLSETIQQTTTQTSLTSQIDAYTTRLPAVLVQGSPERAKVEKEFQALVAAGLPNTKATELAALKAAFGPAEHLKPGTKTRETHQDVGSDGGEASDDGTSWPKDMPAANRRYYQDLVNKGIITPEKASKEWATYAKSRKARAA